MRTCIDCGEDKHLDQFYTGKKHCKPCDVKRVMAWRKANPERHKANKKRQARGHRLRSKYGVTPEQYDALLAAQGGGCACCGKASAGGRNNVFHVDHDHASGKIRGLLCHSCNVGIGHLGDSLVGVERAARYLRRPPRIPK